MADGAWAYRANDCGTPSRTDDHSSSQAHRQWLIDGHPLAEPYVKAGSISAATPIDVLVPDGRLWVMGDNRAASNDSFTQLGATRDIGIATIPVSAVSAVVKL